MNKTENLFEFVKHINNLSDCCKYPSQVIDRMPWTFHSTHTAAQAHGFLNHCTVINHFDCACCTGLLTDSAADAADFTLFLCFCTFFLIGTFYNNVIGAFMDMNHLLWTYFCAGSAADTFLFIYFCYSVFIDRNGSEFAFIYAGFASDTSICTASFPFS